MEKWGVPVWNAEYLKKVGWVKFKKQCDFNYTLGVKTEIEAYKLYTYLTGRTVVGMERKLKSK